jgi:hypothetical protein
MAVLLTGHEKQEALMEMGVLTKRFTEPFYMLPDKFMQFITTS